MQAICFQHSYICTVTCNGSNDSCSKLCQVYLMMKMVNLYQSHPSHASGNHLGKEKRVIKKCQMQHLRNMSMDEQRKLNCFLLRIMTPDQNSTETRLILMKKFLAAVRGKGLGVSLLMDLSTRYWGENTQPALLPPELVKSSWNTPLSNIRNLSLLQYNKQKRLKAKFEISITLLNGLQLVTIE